MAQKVFGIDLGTTYSAIAHINEFDQADVIDNLEGDKTTPSVVYFESPDNFVVGKEAKNGQKVFPDDTVSLIKRVMGEKQSMTYQGKEYTPESISALILRQLVECAQETVESDSDAVVITVPAYFGLVEKEATRNAGTIAGLDVRGIIAEPIAAALSAGIRPGNPQNVFVYDLGGGTFDCTVMALDDSGVEVLAVDGDRELGGADWDTKLFELVLEKFTAQAGITDDPSLDDEFYQDLMSSVEDAKKSLTKKAKSKVRCSYQDTAEMIEVTREEFEEACAGLVAQTVDVARRTLAAAEEKRPGLSIDKYLLVGGSSRMPMIPAALEKELGWELTNTEFDLAVAKGAAIYGQGAMDFAEQAEARGEEVPAGEKRFYLAGAADGGEGMTITNLLSKSVGVRFYDPDKDEPFVGYLLDQGDQLPAKGEATALTLSENTRSLQVQLFEQAGEIPSRDLDANKEITPEGGAMFTDLPDLPKGSPVEMEMKVDSEGLLTFDGYEPTTKQQLTLQVTVSTMQPEEVAAAKDAVGAMVRAD